ncbi:NAD-dependent epimerase/dehydratase [Anaeromyxobacter sp. K]|uniref:NAD-dependent epimerase/dehydratase family protein n=1 Tax=Anaeromyxobacter sp. (strain K) TaxID=447217 RepID=UPI00015F9C99|nr:NAD-dependent epimerase/dehydratase family protein [Anaeromyxobacter sp. K]ACG71273.1 NAD-dependent epimerase/dehydratase [Anaeromyxobacter sp. K]
MPRPDPFVPPELHVVFGAGQVGRRLARELLGLGHSVRLVRRGPPGPELPGLRWLSGDATDPLFAGEACRGADVVYDCTNPPDYHRWDELLAPLRRGIRDAAARAGARLVALDCLYMYGRPAASPFDEDAPLAPCSHKGELRALLARELLEAHARGDLRATTGRASDFFGPGAGAAALLGDRLAARLRAGKPFEAFGDPDLPHAYSYVADVARGLAVLGTDDAALGRAWHLPVAWTGSTRGLVEAVGAALGRPARLRIVPDWLLRVGGLLDPTLGAAVEMTYQWKVPYVPDDRRFRAAFSVEPTPAAEAVAATARAILDAEAPAGRREAA